MRGQGYPVGVIASALGFHRSSYYKWVQAKSEEGARRSDRIDEALARRIRAILDTHETFGYRRVWAFLRFKDGIVVNIKKVHRIMQRKGWQCRLWHHPRRTGPRTTDRRSAVEVPDQLWSTDLTKIYAGADGWCSLIAVIDNGSREVLGFRFSRRGRALEAADALDQAVLGRYGTELPVPAGLRLRSDNGSIFLARHYLSCTGGWGIEQEHTPGYSPEWNGVIERFFRTLKQECVWLHEFSSFEEAEAVITRWIHAYNHERLHSALGYQTPAAWRERFYALPQAA